MKVYELIQELAKYDADEDVRIEVSGKGYEVEIADEDKDGEQTTIEIDVLEYIENISVIERSWPERFVEIEAKL